jgi:uncharacterized repeat protein (TIGR01451 family)
LASPLEFVTKTANLTAVKSGGTLIYTVVVKNLGPYRAASVLMNDPVPSNSTFVSLNTSASCTAPAVGMVGTITCNLGNMPVGATSTFQITVRVDGATNKVSISNTAAAVGLSFDPNPGNSAATVTTQITGNKK